MLTNQHMTGSSEISPGMRLPLLGITIQTANPWIRWGLPIGIGLVVVVPSSQADQALSALSKSDRTYRLGVIEKSKKGVVEIKQYEVMIE